MNSKTEEEDEGTPTWPHIIIVLATAGVGIFNVVFDWLWVDDMLNAESSLVFGRPSDAVIGLMITISTVGTIAVIAETTNLVMKFFFGKLLLQENKAQIICLFVEEIPGMTLNMMLASCREMPVSVFQMLSAGFGMISAFIRVFRVLWKWLTARRKGKKTGLVPFILRTIILAASVYCALAAILAWSFTYSAPPSADTSGIVPPDNIVQRNYDAARYFYKAGIFFSHPQFNRCRGNQENWTDWRYNWLQFIDLMTFTDSPDVNLEVKYWWNQNENILSTNYFGMSETCHRTTVSNWTCSIVEEFPTTCASVNMADYDGMIEFLFVPYERTKTLVFGDIRFQSLLRYNDTCYTLRADEWGYLWPEEINFVKPVARMHYMKTVAGIDYDIGPFNKVNGTLTHFTYVEEFGEGDLYAVNDVWLTGYNECDMTGSNMPNNDFARNDLTCYSI